MQGKTHVLYIEPTERMTPAMIVAARIFMTARPHDFLIPGDSEPCRFRFTSDPEHPAAKVHAGGLTFFVKSRYSSVAVELGVRHVLQQLLLALRPSASALHLAFSLQRVIEDAPPAPGH